MEVFAPKYKTSSGISGLIKPKKMKGCQIRLYFTVSLYFKNSLNYSINSADSSAHSLKNQRERERERERERMRMNEESTIERETEKE